MEERILTNITAPAFTLPDLNGTSHSLSDYRGKIVVLNFWSAECPWVARTDPVLAEYLEEWGEAVTLLMIAPNANEPPELLTKVAQERGWSTILHDADRTVADLYNAETTPHIFVIAPEGTLLYQGAFDDVTFRQKTPTRHYLYEAVNGLLKGEKPEIAETSGYGCTIVYYAD